MCDGATHRLTAGLGVGVTYALHELNEKGELSLKPIIAGGLASIMGTLPDIIEPALHPNHRQFFHGLVFAVVLGGVSYKVYKWEPETTVQDITRFLLLVAGGAYLIHLLCDVTTPKGLPIIGKL